MTDEYKSDVVDEYVTARLSCEVEAGSTVTIKVNDKTLMRFYGTDAHINWDLLKWLSEYEPAEDNKD